MSNLNPIQPTGAMGDLNSALVALDALISLIKLLAAQHGLDGDALGAVADRGDLANVARVKALLAEPR